MRKIVDLIDRLNENEVALYLDVHGIMHASKSKDNAMKYAVGKIMITDEVGSDHGKPVFNGVGIDIYGAGEGYVYITADARDKDIRYIVADGTYRLPEGENSVTVHRKRLSRAEQAAYRIANEYYLELARA